MVLNNKPVAIICLYHLTEIEGKDFFTQAEIDAALADGWVHTPANLPWMGIFLNGLFGFEMNKEEINNVLIEPTPVIKKVGRPRKG